MILSKSILRKLSNLHQTQKFAIAIPSLFFLSCLAKHYLENLRGTWTYAYGGVTCLTICFLMFFFSLANSISILRDLKIKWTEKILWLLLSSSVFLLSVGVMVVDFIFN